MGPTLPFGPVEPREPWEDADVEGLLASLSRWAGDQRAAEAASARARERWLRQQAGEEATFTGVLVDLAERQAAVVIRTDTHGHIGRLRGIGHDVAVLDGASGALTLVALGAVRSVQLAPPADDRDTSGSRSPTGRLSLAGLLAALAADRASVRVELLGGQMVTGSLQGVGADVLSVRVEGEPDRTVHVPLHAVASCRL